MGFVGSVFQNPRAQSLKIGFHPSGRGGAPKVRRKMTRNKTSDAHGATKSSNHSTWFKKIANNVV